MVNERDDRYEGHEDEEEYHFSDDQVSYDVEPETVKTSTAPQGSAQLIAKVKQFQRPIIGVSVFFVLLFIVYKMLTPASTTAPGEIAQVPQMAPKAVVQKQSMPAPVQPEVAQAPALPAQPTQPMMEVPVGAPQAPQPAAAQTTTPAPLPSAPAQGGPLLSTQPPPAVQVVGGAAAAPQTVEERLAILEDQNAKLMAFLQSEYAQKMASLESDNTATQSKLLDLTNRVGNIETSLNQLTQILQAATKPTKSLPQEVTTASQPKINYSVQAIIPGRAWLKSEAGDTLTVAEGDTLKGLGRITKIDPYDGVVQIDVDGKTVSLSYGVSGD